MCGRRKRNLFHNLDPWPEEASGIGFADVVSALLSVALSPGMGGRPFGLLAEPRSDAQRMMPALFGIQIAYSTAIGKAP